MNYINITNTDKIVAKAKLLGLQSQVLFNGAVVITCDQKLYKTYRIYSNGEAIPREYTEIVNERNCLMCRYMKEINKSGISRRYVYLVDVYYFINDKLIRLLPKRAIKDVDYVFDDSLGLDALVFWGNQNILMKPTTGEYIEINATHLLYVKFKKINSEKTAILVYQFAFLLASLYITYDFKETNNKEIFNLDSIKRQVY